MPGDGARSRPHGTVARMRPFGTSIFTEITALAHRFDAANLGQGFPDDDPPEHVIAAAEEAMRAGRNQYAPGAGVRSLRTAIAEHQQRFHGLTYDPDTEIQVTFGATEAIAAAILGLCEPGDEVVVLDPSYDAYAALLVLAGAVPVRVPLTPPDLVGLDPAVAATGTDPRSRWHLDVDRVAAAITPRTRLMLLNTPHNPTGMVLTTDELDALAELCVAADLVAVTDEVYEHLVHRGRHVSLATRPGMRERTITVSSAGKTFACTGWKIGWACAPPHLLAAVDATKQFLSFSGGTPLQFGIAAALRSDDAVFADAAAGNGRRHALLVDLLVDAGVPVAPSDGTYFLTVDARSFGSDDGIAFCRTAPEELGVAAIPVAAFSADPAPVRSLLRLATCKRDEVLRDGIARLVAAMTASAGGR